GLTKELGRTEARFALRKVLAGPGRRFAHPEFLVEDAVQPSVHLGSEGAPVHHREVVRIRPVLLGSELVTHAVEERCTWKRIGHGNPDSVRVAFPHERERRLDVLTRLAEVAELDAEAHLAARLVEPPRGFAHLLDSNAFVHRIEDLW